jgi:hypothetical protein
MIRTGLSFAHAAVSAPFIAPNDGPRNEVR